MSRETRRALLESFSELSIDLAAGWLGSIFILPIFSPPKTTPDLILLTTNFILATIFIAISVYLKTKA